MFVYYLHVGYLFSMPWPLVPNSNTMNKLTLYSAQIIFIAVISTIK